MARTKETIEMTLEVPTEVVDDVAARIDASGDDVTPERVRERVFDVLEVSPELRADGRPVVDTVARRLGGRRSLE